MGGPDQPAPSAKRPPRPRRRPRRAPYIPPFRQRRLDAAQGTKSTTDTVAQSKNWTRMKKHINGVINRVNQHNVAHCALDLFRINIVRGRGVLCKALLRAQLASPSLSPVFAALVAVLGSRMPFLAELLLRRLVAQLKAAYTNQDRVLCFATARFIAQLFNQQVVNELLLLQFLFTCMHDPSDGSIELAVVTLGECAVLLMEKSPKALEDVFQRIRVLLHDGNLSRRSEVMIENLMQMRRTKFANADVLEPHLDLLEEEDIITHLVSLDDDVDLDLQYDSDEFHYDPNYEANEKEYELIKRDILGAALHRLSGEAAAQTEVGQADLNGETGAEAKGASEESKKVAEKPIDMTDAELVDFRRTIYLKFSSGLSYEEWAHKLLKLMNSNKGKEAELCKMIVECCSHEKTYMRPYGLLAQRFCGLEQTYRNIFEDLFANHYATIHRFDTRKIRNIANFFASLLAADVLPWTLFQVVRIVEEETTALSRIFLKILFQEISRTLGESRTKERFKLAESEGHLDSVFPTDTGDNILFSINFFTSIGLGYLTDGLREKLQTDANLNSNAQEGEGSTSSSSISSDSEDSSILSPDSDEEAPHGISEPQPARSNKEKSLIREEEMPTAGSGKEIHKQNDRERETALEGREISVRGSPHTSSFHHEDGVSSYASIERNQEAFVNASSVSGAKRVAQRRTDAREDHSSHDKKRRRYYSPQRHKDDRDGRGSSRYSSDRRRHESSSDDEEYRWKDRSRYGTQRDSREREDYRRRGRERDYEEVRRLSTSPYRSRHRKHRTSRSDERQHRQERYREDADSELPNERYRRGRALTSSERYRSVEKSVSPDLSDHAVASRARSRDHYRRDRARQRRSQSPRSFDSDDNRYRRDSRDTSDVHRGSRVRESSPQSIRRSSLDHQEIEA